MKFVHSVERFRMTSRRPYWCFKTIKRRPCWCPKLILWELNCFLMQTLSFVPINLHRCWSREWKRSIGQNAYWREFILYYQKLTWVSDIILIGFIELVAYSDLQISPKCNFRTTPFFDSWLGRNLPSLVQLDIFYAELYLFFSYVVYSFNSHAFSSIVFIPVSLRWLSICQNWLARPFT